METAYIRQARLGSIFMPPFNFPALVFIFQGFAFIIHFLTLGDGNNQFCQPFFIDKQLYRDDGNAFIPGFYLYLPEFALIQQKFPGPLGFMVELVPVFIFGDM